MDAQTNKQTNMQKMFLGPASHAFCTQLAGKIVIEEHAGTITHALHGEQLHKQIIWSCHLHS